MSATPPPPLPPVTLELLEQARNELAALTSDNPGMPAVYLMAAGQLIAEQFGVPRAVQLARAAAERLPYDCLQRLDAAIARCAPAEAQP